jgi:hypothetical protein
MLELELLVNKLLLFGFFISLIYILYYLIRLIHLLIGLKNETINESNFNDLKNDIFETKKLKILWFSISFLLFYIFK